MSRDFAQLAYSILNRVVSAPDITPDVAAQMLTNEEQIAAAQVLATLEVASELARIAGHLEETSR